MYYMHIYIYIYKYNIIYIYIYWDMEPFLPLSVLQGLAWCMQQERTEPVPTDHKSPVGRDQFQNLSGSTRKDQNPPVPPVASLHTTTARESKWP